MNGTVTPTYLHYKLRLCAPAILTTFSGDPNSASTESFIPGSTLRGVVAAQMIASGVTEQSDEFWQLILSGEVRYLNAYPELAGARSLPSAIAWKREKLADDQIVDLAGFSGDTANLLDAEDSVWPEAMFVSFSAPFTSASTSSGTWVVSTPKIGSRTHQQRDRVKGRSWKDKSDQRHGVIFAYEYLEADQSFCGAIQIMPAAMIYAERIKHLIESSTIFFGRSHRAGYGGGAELVFTGQGSREYEDVTGRIAQDVPAGTSFRALLTSAYVGRHPTTGQIDPTALDIELCRQLDGAAIVERTRCAFTIVGGFNRKWRLELPQAQAVTAGSVLVLRSTTAISGATLRAIEHHGLGERRIEGFGRIVFLEHSDNHYPIRIRRDDDQAQTYTTENTPSIYEHMRPEHRHQLDALEERIILAATQAELDRVAAFDLAPRTQNRPTTSLLGRLRTLCRAVMDEQTAQVALDRLLIWCSDDEVQALKKDAREKLEQCMLNNQNFREWLTQIAQADHGGIGWQAILKASGNQTTLTGLAAKYHLTNRETAEAILQHHSALLRVYFIDAFLAALARLNRGEAS